MVGFVVLYCHCLLIYGPFMHVKFYHTYTPSHLLEMLLIFYMIIIGLKLFDQKLLQRFILYCQKGSLLGQTLERVSK